MEMLLIAAALGQPPQVPPLPQTPPLDQRVETLERDVAALKARLDGPGTGQAAPQPAVALPWADVTALSHTGYGILFTDASGGRRFVTVAHVDGRHMLAEEFLSWANANAGRVQYRQRPFTYGEYEFQVKPTVVTEVPPPAVTFQSAYPVVPSAPPRVNPQSFPWAFNADGSQKFQWSRSAPRPGTCRIVNGVRVCTPR